MSDVEGIDRRCAATLAGMLQEAALLPEAEAAGAMLRVDGHSLRFAAAIERQMPVGEQYLVALQVAVDLDGTPQPVSTGVVSFGDSPSGALQDAIDQWCVYAGYPVVAAVVNRPTWSSVFDAGSVRAFAGAMPVRSTTDLPWPEDFRDRLIELFRPVWRRLPEQPSILHSLEIAYSSSDNSGFVRMETVDIDELQPALAQVPWPAVGDDYVVKQFVVVRRTT